MAADVGTPAMSKITRALSLRDLVDQATPIQLPPPEERRRLRIAARFSQEETALALGVSLRSVCAWETEPRQPHSAARERYGRALAVFAHLSD